MNDNHPGFFPNEKIQLMLTMKIPFITEWGKDWLKENG